MKKLAVVLIGWAVLMLAAPLASSAARVEAGLKLGVNFAWLHGADTKVWPDLEAGWVMRFGWCAGGFVALPFSDRFAIQAEALFTTKGSKEVGALFEEVHNYSLMINYFEVPVLMRFTVTPPNRSRKVLLMAGPAFAFKLHSRFMLAGERLPYDIVRSKDLGLVLGVGFSERKAYAELRYTAGLSKVIEEEGAPLNVKNGVASLVVGILF